MASWANATITNKGNALQGKLLATDKLTITRVVSASGKVPAGQLVNQTDVTDIKQTLTLEGLSYNEEGKAVIKVSLNNTDLAEDYICHQIGIFASDPDEGEILYAIAQEADKGEDIPSITKQPAGYYCGWMFIIGFGGASGISVTIDPANALTVEAGDMRYLQIEVANTDFLKKNDAASTYLKQTDVNIRKNSEDETGDIVSGHFTVGTRSGEYGVRSFASGKSNTASTQNSFVGGGSGNEVSGNDSFIGGGSNNSVSNVNSAICGGGAIENTGYRSFVGGGYQNNISGAPNYAAICGGKSNTIEKGNAFIGGGEYNKASGFHAFVGGINNIAKDRQTVFGRYADTESVVTKGGVSSDTTSVGSLFTIGNGTADDNRGNAFRVTAGGAIYAGTASNATGADKAKMREWLDGNPNSEDRRGFFVTLDGDKIRKATSKDDYIFGVVSAPDIASFIDNTASECWNDKFKRDVYGSYIYEDKVIPAYTDELGKEHPEETVSARVINPDWKPEQNYIPREERPEWAVVCEMGDIVIRDDGTCQVNGYCKPNDEGIGTASETRTPFRVMKRKDESHVLIYKSY